MLIYIYIYKVLGKILVQMYLNELKEYCVNLLKNGDEDKFGKQIVII